MGVVADFRIPSESFLLPEALAAEPSATVEAERLASHSTEWVLPFHWVADADFERFHEAMEGDPTVDDVAVTEDTGDSVLYRVEWADELIELITEITDRHATILEAKAHDENWRIQLRFAKEDQVSSFRDHFSDRGRSFEVEKIYHPTAPRQREYGLTAEQRDTLVTAFERGYYNVPRDVDMEGLADALGVSSNAVSQRLRRGSSNLVRHTVALGADEKGTDGE